MKYFLSALMSAGWLCLAMAAFAQSNAPSGPSSGGAPAAAPAASPPATSAAQGGGKRADCLAAAQGKQGQDRQDQIQLCLAQARVECLKQAIDQKIVGPQRHDFIKSCVAG